MVEQRLDGFVSADAAYTGGTLTTPPIRFSGERLELNIDVAAMGQAQVEVQDEAGRPLPGFELARCRRVMVNDVRHAVTWDGSPSLGSHAGTADPPALQHALGQALRLPVPLKPCRPAPVGPVARRGGSRRRAWR